METRNETLAGLLLIPALALAFTCSVIGSFVMWQVRVIRAAGARHVPFHLHLLHDEDGSTSHAVIACALGALALALPVSLVLQAAA